MTHKHTHTHKVNMKMIEANQEIQEKLYIQIDAKCIKEHYTVYYVFSL